MSWNGEIFLRIAFKKENPKKLKEILMKLSKNHTSSGRARMAQQVVVGSCSSYDLEAPPPVRQQVTATSAYDLEEHAPGAWLLGVGGTLKT